jgi:hypothetical protein
MAAINLQELEAELSRTRLMFEQWSHSMLSRANACKGTHTARMRTSKGVPSHGRLPAAAPHTGCCSPRHASNSPAP